MSIATLERPHAVYACDPKQSRGRRYSQPDSSNRDAFQRDRDRIIHSGAFRRLKGKTQVFVAHEGDQYRTRLTHSLEVSQIARTIARALKANEDLAETVALAHDMGHPPFAHEGERVLSGWMQRYGGFDHNAQALRVITKLEVRYPEFEGLNLSWETLEGVVKHNGPLLKPTDDGSQLPWAITDYDNWQELELHTFASLEAQIAAVSDDIAYNNHDLDDGLRSGLLEFEPLMKVPLVADVFKAVRAKWPDISRTLLIHSAVRELIGRMVKDVLQETRRRLDKEKPRSADDVRMAHWAMVSFSEEMTEQLAELRRHLFTHMYRHDKVNLMMSQASRVMRDIFAHYLDNPGVLPNDMQKAMQDRQDDERVRLVCDYIAGMTDRFAIEEHKRLFAVQGYD